MLVAAVIVAVVVTVLVTVALVLVEPAISRADALRTGGLSGGAVVALYALWLNDRRRRTEEARHELEGAKVSDERFARSVELLGHDSDQVRVGAMHALVELAGSVPRYRQIVLDVLCAYLRMPASEAAVDPEKAAREQQVRHTAQRLITDALPWGADRDARRYHLDLTGAGLVDFRLEGRRIGRLLARGTRFDGVTALGGLHATKPVLLTGAAFGGRLDLREARLDGGLALGGATFAGPVVVSGAVVGTFLDVTTVRPADLTGELRTAPDARVDGDPAMWVAVDP